MLCMTLILISPNVHDCEAFIEPNCSWLCTSCPVMVVHFILLIWLLSHYFYGSFILTWMNEWHLAKVVTILSLHTCRYPYSFFMQKYLGGLFFTEGCLCLEEYHLANSVTLLYSYPACQWIGPDVYKNNIHFFTYCSFTCGVAHSSCFALKIENSQAVPNCKGIIFATILSSRWYIRGVG